MMNLLTLVLVTLPGLTLSFSNTKPPIDTLERVRAAVYPPQQLGVGYVCCNQPPTPPSSLIRGRNLRTWILSLAKRDDRHAPAHWAHDAVTGRAARRAGTSRRVGDTGAIPWNTAGARKRGDTDKGTKREATLIQLLHVLDSAGRLKQDALSRPASYSGPEDLGAPEWTKKRDYTFGGELGGPNVGWE